MTGAKPGGIPAGMIILMAGIALSWLTPCWGMDTMTQSELEDLSGQIGITIAFPTTVTVEARFNSLSQGDTDGWGGKTATWAAAQDDNPGWLVLIGTGSNTGYLRQTIPANSVMTIDVGMTGAGPCQIAGGAPYAGLLIPGSTPFFSFSLTKAIIGLQDPTTVYIKLTNSAIQAAASMETAGFMRAENLMINKADMKSTCYIWAHP